MYNDILPPLGWNRERLEIKYPTISVKDLTNPVFNISTKRWFESGAGDN